MRQKERTGYCNCPLTATLSLWHRHRTNKLVTFSLRKFHLEQVFVYIHRGSFRSGMLRTDMRERALGSFRKRLSPKSPPLQLSWLWFRWVGQAPLTEGPQVHQLGAWANTWAWEDISHVNTAPRRLIQALTVSMKMCFLLCLKIARGNGDPEQRKLQLN